MVRRVVRILGRDRGVLDANRLPRDTRVSRLGAGAEHGDDLPDALPVDHVLDAVVANHQRIARVVVVVVPVPPHGGASAVCSFPSVADGFGC